jgi:hypothetical protein
MESSYNETEWWAEELDYNEEGMEEDEASTEECAIDIYESIPALEECQTSEQIATLECDSHSPLAEEGELVEEGTSTEDAGEETPEYIADFLHERTHGPSSPMKLKQMRGERGSLLKGILAPPIVDSYMKHLTATVTRNRWNRELEKKRYKLGHRFSESITACYTLIKALRTLLPWEVAEEKRVELYMLAEYACACLCNALHQWRDQRRSSLLHKILLPKHWWLCHEKADHNSPRLFGKTTAKALIRHVFPPRPNKISNILHQELESRDKTRFIHKKSSDKDFLRKMEMWVESGCDVFEELEKLETFGLKLKQVFMPTKMDCNSHHLSRGSRNSPLKSRLCRKEYAISCDFTNAANALLMILERLPRGSRVACPVQVGVYFTCISLFKFDVYRRSGFLSSLGISKRCVKKLVEEYPIGNQGNLLGEDLIAVTREILNQKNK